MIPKEIEENLHYIELLTRKRISNPVVGSHLSVLRGHGYDFWDHKRYQRGEDTRKIDWNATARMGYTLIKNTQEEREFDVFVVADLSRSMELASGTLSKKEVLLYVTAALTFSALSDHIRVGFLGFHHDVALQIEPRKGRGHLWSMLGEIWEYQPEAHADTRIEPVLEQLRHRLKRMSLVLLISDFLFRETLSEALAFKQVIAKHDVIPIVLDDPLERKLPSGPGFVRFRELETGREHCVRLSKANRTRYREAMRERRRGLIAGFYRFGLDYLVVVTDQPFFELVAGLFLMRKRR